MCTRNADHVFSVEEMVSLCAVEMVMKNLRIEGLRFELSRNGVGVNVSVYISPRHPEAYPKFLAVLGDLRNLFLAKSKEIYDSKHLN